MDTSETLRKPISNKKVDDAAFNKTADERSDETDHQKNYIDTEIKHRIREANDEVPTLSH